MTDWSKGVTPPGPIRVTYEGKPLTPEMRQLFAGFAPGELIGIVKTQHGFAARYKIGALETVVDFIRTEYIG